MSPITHFLASWVIGAAATENPRDCRLVALAGIAPDADGLGLVSDLITSGREHPTELYQRYHHYLLHGALGAVLMVLGFSLFARQRWRVALLAWWCFTCICFATWLVHEAHRRGICGRSITWDRSHVIPCGFGRGNGRWTRGPIA